MLERAIEGLLVIQVCNYHISFSKKPSIAFTPKNTRNITYSSALPLPATGVRYYIKIHSRRDQHLLTTGGLV